jgi:Gnt-I system high-affinity gluconate transporter
MQLIIIVLAILIQIFLTAKKVSPFLSLLIVATIAGLLLGMQPAALVKSFETGVGSTLGGLALILCLGAVLGKILELSGAAEKIATTLINTFGKKNIQWALLITGLLVGIPLYYNAGFVILVPLVFSLARTSGLPLLYLAIPMAASLSTTHCFLPPHPGPLLLVNAFKADMGKTLLYGLLIAMPAAIIAGPFLGRLLKKIKVEIPQQIAIEEAAKESPGTGISFFMALLPVLLITFAVVGNYFLPDFSFALKFFKLNFIFSKQTLLLLGDPTVAMLVSVLSAIYFLGIRRGKTMPQMMQWLQDAISGIAMILLIITAGGVFKQVIIDSGTGKYITGFASQWNISPLIFAWVVTALLRVAIGSASVAGITAAGIVSPLLITTNVSPELLVLAVGTGSVFGSHINDSGFWMFKEFFKLSLKQTFLSWTVMETTISFIGLIGVLILNMIL